MNDTMIDRLENASYDPAPEQEPMKQDDVREELGKIIGHYYCDDCWYSCPLAEDGCCDDNAGTDCNCGRDEKVNEVLKIVSTSLLQKMERMKKNYPYQNSKTEWCDGYDAALSDCIAIVKEKKI